MENGSGAFALHTRPAVDGPCPGIVPRWRRHRTLGLTLSSIRPFGGATPRSLTRAIRTADYPRTSGQGEQLNFMLRPPPPGFPGHPFAARPPEPARRNHGAIRGQARSNGVFPQTEPLRLGFGTGRGGVPPPDHPERYALIPCTLVQNYHALLDSPSESYRGVAVCLVVGGAPTPPPTTG